MKKTKTFLLLAILTATVVVLAAFAWANWESQISLTFLGMRSRNLPLAVWILLALLAGIVTAAIISSLFGLSNYLTLRHATHHREEERNVQVPPEGSRTSADSETQAPTQSEGDSESGDRSGKRGFFKLKKGYKEPPPSGNGDDWGDGPSKEGDWGENAPGPSTEAPVGSDSVESNPKNYEAEQKPKSESWSGSVYSYGYKDPSGSGVGQSESVYDADYRIITPPPPSPSPQTTSNPNVEAGTEEERPEEGQ
jgi:uncharacterized integral membrane protein